jgi:carbon storage regulator
MLILERKLGEFVNLGEDIKVLVHKIKGNHVWLGFDAPRSVMISRDECIKKELGPKMLIALGESYSLKLVEMLKLRGIEVKNTTELFHALEGLITGTNGETLC